VLAVEAAPQAWWEGAEQLSVYGETMDAKREAAAAAPGRTGVLEEETEKKERR
jgi:hypothetical protein